MHTLFDQLPHNGTATSKAAAKAKAASGKHITERDRVLEYLESCKEYGATRDQIAEALNMWPNTCRPRCRELLLGGWIFEDGDTREYAGHRPSKVLRHAIYSKGGA